MPCCGRSVNGQDWRSILLITLYLFLMRCTASPNYFKQSSSENSLVPEHETELDARFQRLADRCKTDSAHLYLHGDIRRASHTSVGDRVRIEINFDASYRNGPQHSMPIWFRQGFMATPHAKRNWLALTPSRRKEILRYFSRLKSPAARRRNLASALYVLSGAAGRFMGRTCADRS